VYSKYEGVNFPSSWMCNSWPNFSNWSDTLLSQGKISGFFMQWQNHGPYVVTVPYWTLVCEWCMPRVVVQNGHERKDMLRWDWTICSLCNLITEGLTVSGIGRAHVITYRERKSSFWPSACSFKSCISTPIPILEMTIFVIHNYFLDDRNVATICTWRWERPQYSHLPAYSNNSDPTFWSSL
jgi:hypothetical protein